MAINTDQLPQDARKSVGNTKDPVGVIEEGFVPDGNVLMKQAENFARQAPSGATIFNGGSFTEETINAVKAGAEQFQRDGVFAGNNANFTGYYLEDAAKFVIPQMTPLRNMTPRSPGVGIDTINWRAITDYFNGSGPSVATAALQQNGTINSLTYNWVSLSNVMKMLAVRDTVTFEAEIYGKMFQGDVRATVAAKLLPALMQEEEFWFINSGQKLWPPPPVSNVTVTNTGGSLAAATYWILVTSVNANGETQAISSTAVSATTTGGASSISFDIYTVPSATSYRVYVGQGSTQPATSAMWLQGAANQFGSASALNQPSNPISKGYISVNFGVSNAALTSGTAYSTVTSNTAIVVKSTETNTNNLPLTFDGAQALIYNTFAAAGSLGNAGETPLISQPAASNGGLALSDLDTLLENMALNAHADPEYMFVSIKDHKKLSYLVAQGTNFRINQSNDNMANLVAGQRATKYINQTTGRVMDIIMLPYLGQGTIMIGSFTLPYPVTAIDKPPFRAEVNREFWAVEYPPDQSHTSQWMYACFVNECIVNAFLGGWALLNGISIR